MIRTHLRRLIFVVAVLAVASLASAQQKPANEGFVPVAEAPAGEQIPAITLVASAYGFVWVVVVTYVWSLASRLKKVEREVSQLEQRSR